MDAAPDIRTIAAGDFPSRTGRYLHPIAATNASRAPAAPSPPGRAVPIAPKGADVRHSIAALN
jgi:hypothetical protein